MSETGGTVFTRLKVPKSFQICHVSEIQIHFPAAISGHSHAKMAAINDLVILFRYKRKTSHQQNSAFRCLTKQTYACVWFAKVWSAKCLIFSHCRLFPKPTLKSDTYKKKVPPLGSEGSSIPQMLCLNRPFKRHFKTL